MTVTIWHNPRCSKSRATLALLNEHGIDPDVRLYLQDAPNKAELRDAIALIGGPASGLVRKSEQEFQQAGLNAESNDDALIAAMAQFPKLIERPVVFANGKAAIGRPPEAVLSLFD